MSDGTSEWFGGIVQSCSSDGSEAVIFYDDGDSYLLDILGETEWRPALPESIELPLAADTATAKKEAQSTSTAFSSGGSVGESKVPQSRKQNNYIAKSHPTNPPSSGPSLRSLLHKLTGASSKDVSFEKKKTAADPETKKQMKVHLQPSSSDGQQVFQRKNSLIIDIVESSEDESSIVTTKDSSPSKKRSLQIDRSTLDAAAASRPTKKQKQDLPLSNYNMPQVHMKRKRKVRFDLTTHKQDISNVLQEKHINERNVASMQKKMPPNSLLGLNKSPTKTGQGKKQNSPLPQKKTPTNDPKSPNQAKLAPSTPNRSRKSGFENHKPRVAQAPRYSWTNSGDTDEPFQRLLSDEDKDFLASIHITTSPQLILTPVRVLNKNILAWRKNKGLISYSIQYYKRKVVDLKRTIISATYKKPLDGHLPRVTVQYLQSIGITTCAQLLDRSDSYFVSEMNKWEIQHGISKTGYEGFALLVAAWKRKIIEGPNYKGSLQSLVPDSNDLRVTKSPSPIQHPSLNSGIENNRPTTIAIPPWTAPYNMGEGPIERIVSLSESSPAKEYLESIGITTCTELLKLPTSFIAKDMNEWRAQQGLHEIDSDSCAALVNNWKRNAIPSDYNGLFIRSVTDQIAEDRYSPSCPVPIASTSLVPLSTFLPTGVTWTPPRTKPSNMVGIASVDPMADRSEVYQGKNFIAKTWDKKDPLNRLEPQMAKEFLASIDITTSEQLLNTPTADVAFSMNEWRNKNGMYELNKGGCEMLVNNWKNQIIQSL